MIRRLLLAVPLLSAACADEGFGGRQRIIATLPAPEAPLTPPPVPATPDAPTGSLFQPGRFAGLAADQRARRQGDLLTIRLVERTQASKSASAGSNRASRSQFDLPDLPPFNLVPPAATSGGSAQSFSGTGSAAQANQLSGDLTVTVVEVLPGGVLRVAGEKRLRLNRGEEQVQLTGLVRIADLLPDNSIPSTRVADARIVYAGTGQVADQARQGWLARFFGKIAPL
jgi:flagellar L-ring protein precursor FlgH